MNKKKVITYLTGQADKVADTDFDLTIWKDALVTFFNNTFGLNNGYTDLIKNLDYEITVDYDELYPKKVVDKEKSAAKFNTVLGEIISQVKLLNDDTIASESASKSSGKETLDAVVKALKNNLSGKQLKEIDTIASAKKKANQKEQLLDIIRRYDIDITQDILMEIFSCKEIWKHVD